jgi:cytochrome b
MVEYALLTAGAGLRTMATTAGTWLAEIPWVQVGYAALGLIALRLLWRAFTRPRAS